MTTTPRALWHPFADMATVRSDEFVLVRGEGVHVWDDAGNRYLDGSASLWYCNVGHGRTEIADAVAEQLRTLETYSIFGDVANPPAAHAYNVMVWRKIAVVARTVVQGSDFSRFPYAA